tara:strand:+ start:70 stop:267 length:198 start_codon:yes stop_codon:yes gene_type:complete
MIDDERKTPFDGQLGIELDAIWKAIRQDKINSRTGMRVTRTPSGTFINGRPVVQDDDSPEPPPAA